jgi:hypothetical protein
MEPQAVWFVFDAGNRPLGQLLRTGAGAVPAVGAVITNGRDWKRAEVVAFTELAAACGFRRFRVTVRVLE